MVSIVTENYSMRCTIDHKISHLKKLYKNLEDIESNLGELKLKKECKKTKNKMLKSTNREPSPSKTVKFKDLEEAKFKEYLLKNEIFKLKTEINDLKSDNSNLFNKTSNLETQIDKIQNSITKSINKSSNVQNSFEKIDNRFFEINKILTDLNESRVLLQKTTFSNPYPAYKVEKNINSLNTYYTEFKKATHFSDNFEEIIKSKEPNTTLKTDIESLMVDLEKAKSENSKLKLKMNEFESKELSETNNLKLTISKLSNDNLQLKLQLEKLKDSNHNDLEKLKNELNTIKGNNLNELKMKSKINKDLLNEISNLKLKLKHEENQNEEIKIRYLNEINSAKIRFENELNMQNNLMQAKNENLKTEIKNLNKIIAELKLENKNLAAKLKLESSNKNDLKLSGSLNNLSSITLKSSSNNISIRETININESLQNQSKKQTKYVSTIYFKPLK